MLIPIEMKGTPMTKINETTTRPICTDDIYASNSFKLLQQGMKDKQAFNIVFILMLAQQRWPLESLTTFNDFEAWATIELNKEEPQ